VKLLQFINQGEVMFKKWKYFFITTITVLTLGFSTSCGKNSSSNIKIPGLQGPTVTLMQDNLLISLVIEDTQLDGGLRYNIPKYNYSYIEISPDVQSSGTLMAVSISLKDLLNGNLDTQDPQKLPGGRNIPGIASGSLPAVAFSLPKFHNMTLYVGKKLFGIFVPVNVGVDNSIASFRYYIGQKAAGTISLVGKDDKGLNSGVLLMLDMSGAVKSQLMNVFKKYNP
jgi:hypothetical protein